MFSARIVAPLIRVFYRHFYNRLAFSYDAVSALVSRGEWREWCRAAIPFVSRSRVLEIGSGTGNLHLDLYAAGITPFGLDLSPYMLAITRDKFKRTGVAPSLVRARAQALPFGRGQFDTIILTFPPGLMMDQAVLSEFHRVLDSAGRVIWVDAPSLKPLDAWSRFLNWLYHFTNSSPADADAEAFPHRRQLPAGWKWQIEQVDRPRSRVHVMIGKRMEE